MSNNTKKKGEFGSRFGYIMVAAGAAIGLGNIWKFPYLAYRGGGGIFLLTYIVIIMLMAHPMVEMETAIGIPYPLGDVTQSPEDSYRIRENLCRRALKALQTPVTEQTVFEKDNF